MEHLHSERELKVCDKVQHQHVDIPLQFSAIVTCFVPTPLKPRGGYLLVHGGFRLHCQAVMRKETLRRNDKHNQSIS
jgi:hypothetical protein